MNFKQLTDVDKELIRVSYRREDSKSKAQNQLASTFGVTTRTVRQWAQNLGLTGDNTTTDSFRVMIYVIETSRVYS